MAWVEDMSDGTANRTDVLRASPPMFDSRLLDVLSRVHPAVPVLIFTPAVVLLAAWELSSASVLTTAALTVGGYALWTLFEYWLHRIVFHFEPQDGLGARMHWIIHGVHHDHPNDPLRLVMPPAVSVPLGIVVFGILYLVFGAGYAPGLGAGFFAGYLAYDMIHYYIHHFRARGPARADAARAAHAPSLPGRHKGLWDQRALLGRGVPDLLTRAGRGDPAS